MSDMTKSFQIEGMHCTSCAMTIDWEIEDVEGVRESRTSYADGRTTVIFDPAVASESEIAAAITRAGFRAQASTASR